jgi:hypothetical protein
VNIPVQAKLSLSWLEVPTKNKRRNISNVPIIKKNPKSSPLTYNCRVSGVITKEKRQKGTLVTFQKKKKYKHSSLLTIPEFQAKSPGPGAVPKVKKMKKNVSNVPKIKKNTNTPPLLTIPEFKPKVQVQEPSLK